MEPSHLYPVDTAGHPLPHHEAMVTITEVLILVVVQLPALLMASGVDMITMILLQQEYAVQVGRIYLIFV
jgi:hypothetical protein